MNSFFYEKPMIFPRTERYMDPEVRDGINQLCRRATELLRAAALIDGVEPGLLTLEDRESARRRGANCAKRVLAENNVKGKPHIAYFRALSSEGFRQKTSSITELAKRTWILEDRCGLADSYLRGAADAALQKGAEVILCPCPIRRDRMEALYFPSVQAAFFSDRAVRHLDIPEARCVHLDRIPDSDRKRSLRSAMRESRTMIHSLMSRAASYLTDAAILSEMQTITCEEGTERL